MDGDDLAMILQNIDELFGADEMELLSPTQIASNTTSAITDGELEAPLPIRVTEVISGIPSAATRNTSPTNSTHSSRSSLSDADGASGELENNKSAPLRRRVSMKERLRNLEDEVSQLNAKLQVEQKKAQTSAWSREANHFKQIEGLCEPMWKSIATRQMQYRQNAEAENVHLRNLVEAQARYLQSVRRAFRRQPNRTVSFPTLIVVALQLQIIRYLTRVQEVHRLLNVNSADVNHLRFGIPEVFDKLMIQLDSEYACVNHIWESLCIAEQPCSSWQQLPSGDVLSGDAKIVFINCASIPFKIDDVEAMIWKYLSEVCFQQSNVDASKVRSFLRPSTLCMA